MRNAHLNYRSYDSPFYALLWAAKHGGPDKARAVLPDLMKMDPKDLTWETVGQKAGLLSDENMLPEAIAILECVAYANPNSGQAAFDLARASLLFGDLAKGRTFYAKCEKAGENKVDPKRIQWDLDYLQAAEHPVPLDTDYMQKLTGTYELRQITLKDGRLHYFREGGAAPGPRPLLAFSKDTFFIQGVVWFRFEVEFDDSGNPIKLVGSYDDGRRDEARRNR